jgi:hypothetical protein
MADPASKLCGGPCARVKPLTEFKAGRSGGRAVKCRECTAGLAAVTALTAEAASWLHAPQRPASRRHASRRSASRRTAPHRNGHQAT